MTTDTQQVHVRLPKELARKLRHEAVDGDRSMSELVSEIVRAHLDRGKGVSGSKRQKPSRPAHASKSELGQRPAETARRATLPEGWSGRA